MRVGWATMVAGLALLLAGCVAGTPVQPRTEPVTDPGRSAPAGGAGSTAHVLEQRRAAGIADCPVSDPEIPARADGLPDLTLDCLGADSRVRLAGLRGAPLVINVWAQWCGPCRQEAPFLREAAARAGDRVQFLGIDYVDPRPDLAVEFADQAGWRYPQLVDPDRVIAADLQIIGPPQTILVTADGRVAYRPDPYPPGGDVVTVPLLPERINELESALGDPELGAKVVALRPAAGGRQAAVLVLFGETDGAMDVTVVERAHTLRNHAAQIAFPGGGVDAGDISVEAAALREAKEEIGLRPESVRLLGSLPAAHVAVSGFDVTTVVGWWVRRHPVGALDRGEVESVHHIPVDHLIDPENRRVCLHPSGYRGPAFLADDLFIWGLTAHLLDGLFDLAGWAQPWSRTQQVPIPRRFLRDRSGTEPSTDPNAH
jgi:8-oxo-dGTP pyrophosphatase MutT (NUDIX family)/thiol-disulfide isomerase/thioredoxin